MNELGRKEVIGLKIVFAIIHSDDSVNVTEELTLNHFSVTKPVSYTHLDVYKRQDKGSGG